MSDVRSRLSTRPVSVEVRRYPGVLECDVVITARGREAVVTCPDHERALRWALMECKSYRITPPFAVPTAGQYAA